jgi:tyrosinase
MANPIVIRPDADHANVPALEDAYQKMQAISAADNRSWIYWAEFHGYNRYECWHHASIGASSFSYDLFLPWHRAYLSFFQNTVLDQNPQAILPWWDWTSQTGLPAAFTATGSPLESGPMPSISGQPARQTTRNPGAPADLPSAATVDALVNNTTDFRDFSDQLQGIHDGVHGWVGGDMGVVATSAFDPVFWAHHTMIDRIWYLWQLKHGLNNIPASYLDKALFPGYTVQQVLDVHTLGYDYATAAVAGGSNVPPGVGGSEYYEPPKKPIDYGEPKPRTTGPSYTSEPIYLGALDREPSRADIVFHHVDHAGASYEGRVYLNHPEADYTTGYDHPSYAGSYHIFGHGGCLGDPGHCDVKPRRPYDPRPSHPLTKTKKVVVATYPVTQAVGEYDKATVTVVPVIEPLPYEPDDEKYVKDPVHVDYVQILTYR